MMSDINYKVILPEMIAKWNSQHKNVIIEEGEEDDTINEEYFVWYLQITQLRIDRLDADENNLRIRACWSGGTRGGST